MADDHSMTDAMSQSDDNLTSEYQSNNEILKAAHMARLERLERLQRLEREYGNAPKPDDNTVFRTDDDATRTARLQEVRDLKWPSSGPSKIIQGLASMKEEQKPAKKPAGQVKQSNVNTPVNIDKARKKGSKGPQNQAEWDELMEEAVQTQENHPDGQGNIFINTVDRLLEKAMKSVRARAQRQILGFPEVDEEEIPVWDSDDEYEDDDEEGDSEDADGSEAGESDGDDEDGEDE